MNEIFSIHNAVISSQQSAEISPIAGIDIGGTKIAVVVADAGGPRARIVRTTTKVGAEDAIPQQALALLDEVCQQAQVPLCKVKALGIASCGPFVKQDGYIELVTPNLCGGLSTGSSLPNDWTAIRLEHFMCEKFSTVRLENDCVSALLAERTFGNLKSEDHCAYVTWSTGIGFGFCVDGNVLRGKNANAGHAGHMLMSEVSTAKCGCGNIGDLEALISGANLQSQFARSAEDIFQAAQAADSQAQAIVRQSAIWLGRALYNLAVTLDIRVFAIGGSVWQHHGHWLRPLVLHELSSRLPALTHGIEIIHPLLQNHAVEAGALFLVMPEQWVRAWQENEYWRGLQTVPSDTLK